MDVTCFLSRLPPMALPGARVLVPVPVPEVAPEAAPPEEADSGSWPDTPADLRPLYPVVTSLYMQ